MILERRFFGEHEVKVTLPPGYCATCTKRSLDKVDVITEAEEKLAQLKQKMLTAFLIGDQEGALAEICYLLDITPGELSVSGAWESPKLTEKTAAPILREIAYRFPHLFMEIADRMGIIEEARRRDEERRRRDARWQHDTIDYDFGRSTMTIRGGFKAGLDAATPSPPSYMELGRSDFKRDTPYVPPFRPAGGKNER